MRKVLRSEATEFRYDREEQPLPRIGPWQAELDRLLVANEAKPGRERLTLIRVFENLRGQGYEGGYDAVRRYARGWQRDRSSTSVDAFVPLSFAPGEAYQFDWSHEAPCCTERLAPGPCPGEWLVEKHGPRTRRSWRKLHLGVDADTGEIVAAELTSRDADDGSQVGPLLDQVARPVASFTGDGAFDRDDVYGEVAARHPGARIIVPPRSSAVPSRTYKRVIGDALRSRKEARQATEVVIAACALNRMLELGRPEYVRVA